MSESMSTAKAAKTTTPSAPIVATTSTLLSPSATSLPPTSGDTDLLGNPSKVGGFNVTTGVVLYSAFLFAFLVAIGFATMKRAQLRKKFRLDTETKDNLSAIEAGNVSASSKGISEKGGAASSKDNRKPLEDVKNHEIGRNARLAEAAAKTRQEASESNKRPAGATEERRQEHSRNGSGVRFDENGGHSRSGSVKRTLTQQPSLTEKSPARRTSTRKNTASPDVDSDNYMSDSLGRYQDDFPDLTDYSIPSLTASTTDNNAHPQAPRAAYQQAAVRPSQPSIKRSQTGANPGTRPPRAASHVSRSGSVNSQVSRSSSSATAHSRSASNGSPEHNVKRSNSSRLPPSMRVGTPSAGHESGTYT